MGHLHDLTADRRRVGAARRTPRFVGTPASEHASKAARGASRKRDTRCELLLRSAVWRIPLRYRIAVAGMPGRPDLVFARERVVVFCDGDFWHGRNLEVRLHKLMEGHNSGYWTAKITTNVLRDAEQTRHLEAEGWLVLRFWESEIRQNPEAIARIVADHIRRRRRSQKE